MTDSRRIILIDQARGLAALGVAWFHITNQFRDTVSITGAGGRFGVEAFFVISGFVIPNALARYPGTYRWRDIPDFLARRMIRLEPPYIASIALLVGLNLLARYAPGFRGGPIDVSVPQVLAHLLYLIPFTRYDWIQFVYWTLAYEFVFYLSMAGLFPVVGREKRWPSRAVALIVIGLIASGTLSQFLALFVMGFFAFRLATGTESLTGSLLAIAASTAAMIHVNAVPEAIVGAATAVILASHARLGPVRGRLGDACVWLGTVSYSLYLIHLPIGSKVVNLGRRFVSGTIAELVLALVALTICLVVAWLFCKLFERPFVALARRLPPLGRTARTVANQA